MSYCRWSSDNWKSDVYVYEADEGMVIYVAASRFVGDAPQVPAFTSVPFDEWKEASQIQHAWIETCAIKSIGGPFDGDGFDGLSYQAAFDKLKEIQAAGYHVPEYVFSALQEDINEEIKNGH